MWRSHRGLRAGHAHIGVSQEAGRPFHLQADRVWYCRARATERGGTDEGESEYSIVPVKQGHSPRRTLWREGGTEFTGLLEGKMEARSSPTTVSTRLRQIAELARQGPDMVLTTLAHHIDVELLREAYRLTCKSGAVGVDGQTATA